MPSFLKHGFWELIRVCKASSSLTELSPWPVFPLLYTESVSERAESCSLKGTGLGAQGSRAGPKGERSFPSFWLLTVKGVFLTHGGV